MVNDSSQHQDLLPGQGSDVEDGEGWLISYLDVLTLLITLFVLLLSLAGKGEGDQEGEQTDAVQPVPAEDSRMLPERTGVLPHLKGKLPEGIAMSLGTEGVTLRIDDTLLFASGQAELTEQGRGLLDRLRDLLLSHGGHVSVEGHTDNVPISTARYPSNWELSGARAIAVLRHLQQLGVPADRLRAIGYADTRPMADNSDVDGRAANRRVELVLHEPADP